MSKRPSSDWRDGYFGNMIDSKKNWWKLQTTLKDSRYKLCPGSFPHLAIQSLGMTCIYWIYKYVYTLYIFDYDLSQWRHINTPVYFNNLLSMMSSITFKVIFSISVFALRKKYTFLELKTRLFWLYFVSGGANPLTHILPLLPLTVQIDRMYRKTTSLSRVNLFSRVFFASSAASEDVVSSFVNPQTPSCI